MNNSMLKNGLQYILSSAEQLVYIESLEKTLDSTDLIQDSLLQLYSGIELVMRARLYNTNWTYLFADMNQADKEALEYGNYEPVGFLDSLDRLEYLCEIQIPEKDKRFFRDLQNKKNNLDFNKDTLSFYAIEAVMYHAIGAVLDLVSLDIAGKDEKRQLKELKKWFTTLDDFHKEALISASEVANNACPVDKRVECPSCGEVFLVPDNAKSGKCHCYYCGYEVKGEIAAKVYLANIRGLNERRILKDGGIYPLFSCPTCKKKALIQLDKYSECFACGRIFEDDPNGRKKVIPNQAEGIKAAKARGVVFGRPQAKLPKNFDEVYNLWAEGKLSNREAAAKLNMPVSTFRNRAEKYREELKK